MTEFFKRLFSWPTVFVFGLGATVSAIALWLSRKNEVSSLKDALIVQKHRQDAFAYKAEVAKLEADGEEREGQLAFAKLELSEHQRRAVEIVSATDLKDKSDEEVARMFDGVGL